MHDGGIPETVNRKFLTLTYSALLFVLMRAYISGDESFIYIGGCVR